jgi:hypothetical protein
VVTLLFKHAASDCSHLCMCWRVTEGLLPQNPLLKMFFLIGRESLLVVVCRTLRLGTITAGMKCVEIHGLTDQWLFRSIGDWDEDVLSIASAS